MELPETFGSEVFRFLTMPAFGAQSKREIELKVFELVYRERLLSGPALLTSQISAELRVTRARARQLLLETRLRLEAENHENREQVLRRVVSSWVDQPLEYDGERFSVVVGDPWVREAIKGHAADNGVPLDGSFNSDIVKFTWPGYMRLLSSLYQELDEQDAKGIFGAEIRERVLSGSRPSTIKNASGDRRSGATPQRAEATEHPEQGIGPETASNSESRPWTRRPVGIP